MVPRNPETQSACPPLPEVRPQRRLRRPDGSARPRRQRHSPLLHERGGEGGEERLCGEARAGFYQVSACAVNVSCERFSARTILETRCCEAAKRSAHNKHEPETLAPRRPSENTRR